MNSKFTLLITMTLTILFASCSKNEFNERDAIAAQKDLLNLKYQHELDLETLKQKGATALQQLLNAAALEQLKLNDSLTIKNAIDAKKADYSIVVVDVVTNAPVVDADVTVSSEGKIYSAKTGAQGVATFTALYLFPTSTFLISKTGYAATRILQQYVAAGPIRLWNTSESTNEISGNLFIETDLTNITPEKVGKNVLVTASANIPTNAYGGTYTVSFPAYTTDEGAYSIKVPAAPNGYSLSFEQITADQKLYVNATDDDAVTSFPNSLPRLTTIKTYFNVNTFNAPVPNVINQYYFKFSPDKTGRILYLSGSYNYNYNQVFASSIGDKYQVERLDIGNYNYNGNYVDVNTYNYGANAKVDVQLVDVAGDIVKSAPQLAGLTGTNGKLLNYTSTERGTGYVHLKRSDAGAILDKGILLKANVYDNYSNLYNLNFNTSLNTSNNRLVSTSFLSINKGDKKVINFYYGSGDSRVKQVY